MTSSLGPACPYVGSEPPGPARRRPLRWAPGEKDGEAIVSTPGNLVTVLKGIRFCFAGTLPGSLFLRQCVYLVSQVEHKAVFSQMWTWQCGTQFWAVIQSLASFVNSRNPCSHPKTQRDFEQSFHPPRTAGPDSNSGPVPVLKAPYLEETHLTGDLLPCSFSPSYYYYFF